MGLSVALVSGDRRPAVETVGRATHIDTVFAGVLPAEKALRVKELQDRGECVAFVGDGINDAPALSQADIGIALGGGTDVAIENGEIVLMKDDPCDVAAALGLGRAVMRRIRQNLFWALAYNAVLIPLAAGILYPFTHWVFRPELGGLAMALSSVTVVSLSLMLNRWKPERK